jgi:acyl-CoA synthetase (AMP-forming)/AMP-acid ligase II
MEEVSQPAFVDISTRLSRHAQTQGDADAVVFGGERISYREFDRRVSRCANALIRLGVKPGDRVAMLASPSAAYLEAFLGTLRAGGCAVPLSPMASEEQLALMLADSDAKALFVSANAIETGRTLARSAALLPGGLIAFGGAGEGTIAYDAFAAGTSDATPNIPILTDMLFNIIYSSGTTGVPKGITHSHATRTLTLDRFGDLGFGRGCRSLVATPLYSNTTLASWLPTIGLGGTVIIMPKFDVRSYLELAAAERATHTILVPVQYQRILADPEFDRFDLSAFKFKMTTSAPMQIALKREIARRWPGPFIEMYGLTEGGGICVLDVKADDAKLDTVGKPAFGCVVKIVDDRGEELPQGETGEIAGRGPIMMQGYHNQPQKSAEILWRDRDGETYFRSGDMGWFDDEGYLHLSDRKKDMIISGGFNVFAADLEAVLYRHADVDEAAVIGVPSLEWGETPLALVVPRPGAHPDPDALREWANGRLGKAQRLSRVELRDALPRNTLGKVLKRELRAPYWTAPA